MKVKIKRRRCLFCGAPASSNYYVFNCVVDGREFSVCERCLEKIKTDNEYDRCIFCGRITEPIKVKGRASVVHNPQAPYVVRTVKDRQITFYMPVCSKCKSRLNPIFSKASVIVCDRCRREVHPETARTIFVHTNNNNKKIGDFCEECIAEAVQNNECILCGKPSAIKIKARSLSKKVTPLDAWVFELPLCEEHAKPFLELAKH